MKSIIHVKCPCCQHVLEVDVEKEKVLAHRKGPHLRDDAKAGEDAMDVLVRSQKESSGRIQDQFAAAQDRMKNQGQRLEDLFKEAKERAKTHDDDEDPQNPFAGGKKVWD